ncbi:MAG TPA: hypothetical protein PLG66_02150 [Calditrichia bacterium]|nr:hypothetical protein [Calditrichia bacterium]
MANASPTPDPLAQLRDIILNEDQARIHTLEEALASVRERFNDREELIRHLEPIIAELLERRIENARDEMAESLSPVISQAIRIQIEESREDVIDALYPVVGGMVRKAVAEAMKKLAAQVNESMNKTFNLGLLWRRLRARVSGVPEGEAVLAGILPCDAGQALLLSRDSGLLIGHADLGGEEYSTDAQVIGGMLSAINGFMKTSFAGGDPREGGESELGLVEAGDNNIAIDTARYTILAVVYSGNPHPEMKSLISQAHQAIHRKFYRKLRNYNGDNTEFQGLEKYLRALLKQIRKTTL